MTNFPLIVSIKRAEYKHSVENTVIASDLNSLGAKYEPLVAKHLSERVISHLESHKVNDMEEHMYCVKICRSPYPQYSHK